jgi:methylated-DNA-protein-cysteine methyltransferase-like protein
MRVAFEDYCGAMITETGPNDNHQRIWQVVAAIPVGKVASYGQVATLAGLPRAARLVGKVMAALPADSKIPWHRVIRANRKLAFPEGSSRHLRQRQRLAEEGVILVKGSVDRQCFEW